jgi:hypothetical protein
MSAFIHRPISPCTEQHDRAAAEDHRNRWIAG